MLSDIDIPALTISRLLVEAVRRHGDRIAVQQGEQSVTYSTLDLDSDRLAAFLSAHSIGLGDCVALYLRNCIEYVVADLAILKLGAVKVPLNEFMISAEVAYCLNHSGALALISHASLPFPPISEVPHLKLHIEVGEHHTRRDSTSVSWDEVSGNDCPSAVVRGNALDPAIVMYTGGTTGSPKGVLHLQGRLAINLLAHVVCAEIGSEEVMLLSTPLPHSAGFFLQAGLLQGARVVLASKFDASACLRLVAVHRVSWVFAVPTMLYRFLDVLSSSEQRTESLRTIVYGAAPMDGIQLKRGLAMLGAVFLQIYGQSECPNLITTLTKGDHMNAALLASCGRPVPFLEIRVTDEAHKPMSSGCVGQVEVRSPYLLAAYFADQKLSEVTVQEGWLQTGDLGYLNQQGYLFLVDRTKDMIITGGLNVYSVEVESALREDPAVSDVGVIGVPHPDWGEAIVALVVSQGGESVDQERIIEEARRRLSAYKLPKRVVFVDALPLTRYGKPDKKRMRQLLQNMTA